MTIAYVLKMYPRFSETFIINEILELERQGVDVRIYSLRKPNDGRFHASLARVRAPVIYLPEYLPGEVGRVFAANRSEIHRNPRQYVRVLLYAWSSRSPLKAFRRLLIAGVLADHLRTLPAQHLHAHFASSPTRVAMFAHLLTGIPYSFTAHAKDIFLNEVDRDLLRDKIRAAKFVATVSDYNQDFLMRLYNENGRSSLDRLVTRDPFSASPDRIRRLYNGIDLTQFSSSEVKVSPSAREPLILSVGRLVEKKGFDVLIRACALLRERHAAFRCEIIGKGPEEAKLRALIQEFGLDDHVLLVGPKPQDQVIQAYQRAAVFALPCITGADGNRDGLPTVLLEAMAMHLPVVSTDLTGIPEIVDGGTSGFLVPQKDTAALAYALERLLTDPVSSDKMGEAGRQTVIDKFNLRKNVAVLRQWLLGEISDSARQAVGAKSEPVYTQAAIV